MIIEQTYNLLKSRYIGRYRNLTVADCRIGAYLTAVRLSDNSIGTATTMSNNGPFCAKHNRDFGDLTPLKIKGQKAQDIIESRKRSGIISGLKTAVLNAICSKIIASGGYSIIENCDPVDLLEFTSDITVTVVGAFQTYIRKISQICEKLFVLEMNENALTDDQKKLFVPSVEYKRVIPFSDIVIITGQTLVNNTIDELLPEVKPGARVIVTGPSSNILPDILFQHNVDIIGAFRITEPEILLDVVSEGGMSYHLFKYCAQKICILKDDGAQAK
jgi:uncharacterized protein (DUF4213/DUF364 family)